MTSKFYALKKLKNLVTNSLSNLEMSLAPLSKNLSNKNRKLSKVVTLLT
jgi:hypothetical protein